MKLAELTEAEKPKVNVIKVEFHDRMKNVHTLTFNPDTKIIRARTGNAAAGRGTPMSLANYMFNSGLRTGTAGNEKALKEAVREANPKNSKELAAVLIKVTKLDTSYFKAV